MEQRLGHIGLRSTPGLFACPRERKSRNIATGFRGRIRSTRFYIAAVRDREKDMATGLHSWRATSTAVRGLGTNFAIEHALDWYVLRYVRACHRTYWNTCFCCVLIAWPHARQLGLALGHGVACFSLGPRVHSDPKFLFVSCLLFVHPTPTPRLPSTALDSSISLDFPNSPSTPPAAVTHRFELITTNIRIWD
ncbi:hypothetical protein AUP68_15631 [Ilyonectria robusta]